MARLKYTPHDHVLDSGKQLWPPREDPSQDEQAVWDALDSLTKRQRLIVEMFTYEELTFGQIAAKLGISKQSAHSTYKTALTNMEESINATLG